MSEPVFKALVVDDDRVARKMVAFALQNEGFHCDQAGDGVEALRRMETEDYDLVVTDLRMPNKHGHSLSIELLGRQMPPVVVVHSSVDDPWLAKDLMSRGVDDIIYKPTNYAAFAAKIRVRVERRRQTPRDAAATTPADSRSESSAPSPGSAADQLHPGRKLSMAEFESRLSTVWNVPPLSQAALTLLDEVRDDEASVSAIAGIIQRDEALTADVLRLANCAVYKGTFRPIVNIEEAISRIGMRRLGELAVVMSAMGAVGKSAVPWFDKELASKRSLAAGIAVSRLLDAAAHKPKSDNLVLAALMYPLGRVILGTLFPSHYEQMLAASRRSLAPLQQLECDVFPEPHSAAAARVLARWGVPKELHAPLAYTAQSFGSLSSLSEASRSDVLVIKTGILIGRLAVRRWLAEDLIDFPSAEQFRGLGTITFDALVNQVRSDLAMVTTNGPAPDSRHNSLPPSTAAGNAPRRLRYCNLSLEPIDFVRSLLTSIGFELEVVPAEGRHLGDQLVLNCTQAPSTRLAAKSASTKDPRWVIVVDKELPETLQDRGEIIRLPASCGALWTACEKIAESHRAPLTSGPDGIGRRLAAIPAT